MDTSRDERSVAKILEIGREPLLIIGGPGTRKSTLLAQRVNSIIEKSLSQPQNIHVLSFNNASVRDLKKKLEVCKVSEEVKISTVHSLAYRILWENFPETGWRDDLNITEDMDDELILRDSLCEQKLDVINKSLADLKPVNDAKEYYKFKKFYNGFNFYEITRKAIRLLESNKEIRNKLLNKINFLIVDEYQDLNKADQKFIEILTEKNSGLTICGDDDQSIYSFRHASPDGIVEKYKSGKFEIAKLEFSSRCPDFVIKIANHVRSKISSSIPKTLTGRTTGQKGLIVSLPSSTKKKNKEAEWVAGKIIGEINEYFSTSRNKNVNQAYRILVLASEENVYSDLKKILRENDIDFKTKQPKVLKYNLTRQIHNALKFVENPSNNLALRWVLHGLGLNIDYNAIINKAIQSKLSLYDTIGWLEYKKAKNVCDNLLTIEKEGALSEMLQKVLKILDIERKDSDAVNKLFEIAERVSSIKDLVEKIESGNLEPEEYVDDSEKHEDFTVELMTIHSAKGLTADVVFIMGLENGIFPRNIQGKYAEEELRLFYVALTRTKNKLYLSFVRSRKGTLARGGWIRKRSRFIDIIQELPNRRDYLDFVEC